jgi:hypothetical protein
MEAIYPAVAFIIYFLLQISFILVPIILGVILWKLWMTNLHYRYTEKLDWVTLHIKLPSEIRKTPEAMEVVITSMYQTGGVGSWYEKWWLGNLRPWFSLEIVSIGGAVHFFIRAERRFKDIIVPQIYAQYPTVEVREVDDYTRHMEEYTGSGDWAVWSCEWKLGRPDPIPIKTYREYGLDTKSLALDEDQRIDPLTPMIEHLGSMNPHEQAWIQILITPSMTRFKKPGSWFKKQDWKKEAAATIKKMKEDFSPEDPATGKKMAGTLGLTKRQNEIISAVEQSMEKFGFDTGIRMIYLVNTTKVKFRVPALIGMMSAMKNFNSEYLNEFKVSKSTFFEKWKDINDFKVNRRRREMFRAYVERSYFFGSNKRPPFVLNTEELATIFHFPGRVSETPTLERVGAKKSEPPSDLPM